jgi:hypothetical protein
MAKLVVSGAILQCSQGVAPSSLVVTDQGTGSDGPPVATVADHVSMTNITGFAMCRSLANPSVASATSAAQGTLTPMPCVPLTPSGWSGGSGVITIRGKAALLDSSTCSCSYNGSISIVAPASQVDGE